MSLNVAVVGATGKTGKAIVEKLSKAGHTVTAIVRNPTKGRDLEKFGNVKFETIPLESTVSKFALYFSKNKFDSVIFAAGTNAFENLHEILQIELDGALKIIEAVEEVKIPKFILISAINSDDRDFWYPIESIRPYYMAKRIVDKFLERGSLNYTILQPGPLVEEPGLNKIKIPKEAIAESYENFNFEENYYDIKIPIDDVANAAVQVLNNEKANRKILPLVNGDTSIEEVIEKYL
ncbi:hypothetical protein BN7_5231 [Wickerhamomyces ciferrii]|uniref:NAD(P)-binding domain-containing protein n=1 Tax=Wickerhamomyces ciferrii (strain ATCC 14091 / BCRC 22168 / CBS 111 / JCM 3599 / NBRC 0793 / NRRL Y-1031 F-60-10) TaxID=1206466 RepID=K0KR63_WICCF|nr:uncharacterized protein BN7_5231 [Wickerhamomyces ciferrii]CCH45646.1 hypothetical protein BN7_5231 [Wickerhamomyces ciferrii]